MAYEVYVKENPVTANCEVYIIDTSNGKRFVVKPMELIWTEVEGGKEYEPTLAIPHYIARELFKAMKAAFTGAGIKTDDENMIKAELKATKYHLQDMRKLVFRKSR